MELKGLYRSQLDNRVASAGLGFSRVVGGSCDRSGLFRTYGPLSNSDIAFYSEDWPEIQLRLFVESFLTTSATDSDGGAATQRQPL